MATGCDIQESCKRHMSTATRARDDGVTIVQVWDTILGGTQFWDGQYMRTDSTCGQLEKMLTPPSLLSVANWLSDFGIFDPPCVFLGPIVFHKGRVFRWGRFANLQPF